jgi:hypothetical protein
MADDLRRSVADLQSPVCGGCHTAMKWYRSIKLAEHPTTIAHFFQCPNCNRITETRSALAAADGDDPPPRLSKPAGSWGCAA